MICTHKPVYHIQSSFSFSLNTNITNFALPFFSFMVSIIEEGIRKYGVGTDRRVCVLLDRSTFLKAGVKKKEDLSVIPNLVKLFQHLYSTIIVSCFVFI